VAPDLGVRVVVDVRPLQEPDEAPVTAAYLGRLLRAFVASPVDGESFVVVLRPDLPDPSPLLAGLPVAGRRLIPPTRFLKTAAQTVDPFLIRGATIGTGWLARRSGAAGRIYHAAGTIPPLGSRAPVVVTLLDLAAWELPAAFQRTPSARFGARLRAQLLRESAVVICGTHAVASRAARRLRVPPERLRVVPLAARDEFLPAAGVGAAARVERERLGLPDRYLVYPARHDARHDLQTLLTALGALARRARPERLGREIAWPPRILVVDASPDDRAALARASLRSELGDVFAYAPSLPAERLATLVAGGRAALAPRLSDAAGLAAIEALACGVPVVASAVDALPEIVGTAGVLVPPRAPDRLAAALEAVWCDDEFHRTVAGNALERARGPRRTWADVAAATRRVYADVVALR
jgi:glycosyltransferase involved in cell wall biosynthesis